MSVMLIVAVPIISVAIILLLVFRQTSRTPVLVVAAFAGTLLAITVTVELWRRLGRLADLAVLNEELRYRATHDLLMQVPNRDQLQIELARAMQESGQAEGAVGLLFLDLDRFKFVNDTLGHAAGDELLKAVGLRIKRALRSEDAVLARVGGDELVVLMRDLRTPDHLQTVAERVIGRFKDPFVIDGVQLQVGTSIGMAIAEAGEKADELYRHADAALYEAKENGRGRAVMADRELRAKREARVRTELALRAALADRNIEAWLQPEVDLVTGEIVAAEALARWRTEDSVAVAGAFISVARNSGMLEELMIDMADQLWDWRRSSDCTLPVALNVSTDHLETLLQHHDRLRSGRPFEGLRLEIAETDIIRDFEGTRAQLSKLRSLGAMVMLDDFGAGYSSLQMLSDLPIDGIKIDRSYVARVETDDRVRALITSISEFARATGMIVVAEGVETLQQANFLVTIGIDRGQGFLFSPAVDPLSFEALVETGPLGVDYASGF